MLRNYYTIAIRNFWKHKGFSALNLLGLSIGLASCLLITLFVTNELSYDRYNKLADRIYRVNARFRFDGQNLAEELSPAALGPAMVADYPSIEKFVRLHDQGAALVRKGSAFVSEPKTCFADSSLLDVFSFTLLAGNRSALTQPHSVILSETLAAKYFSGLHPADIIGKYLEINDTTHYVVTAVFKDMPALSHIHFDLIRSLSTQKDSREVNWLNNDYITYLLVKPGTGAHEIEKDLAQATKKYGEPLLKQALNMSLADMEKKGDYYRYETIALTRIHLYSDLARELEPSGNILYVRIFSIIALFILLLACVNFMNLSTARSSGRSKEVGVRKVLGSARADLVVQFLFESVLLSILATVLAIAATICLLPSFNQISGQHISMSALSWGWLAPVVLIGAVLVGLLAGSYPALFLSAFRPMQVLKGKLATGFRGSWLRNSLVVFQFTTAIALIVSTLVIYHQLSYIRNKRLGYSREEVLIVKETGNMGDRARLFKTAIEQISGVSGVTMANSFPTTNEPEADAFFKDASKSSPMAIEHWYVDADYIRTMGMSIAQGRNFSPVLSTDTGGLLINETAAAELGFKDPLHEHLYQQRGDDAKIAPHAIIGIIKDFNSGSLRTKTPAIIMSLAYDPERIAVRMSVQQPGSIIHQIEQQYHAFAPSAAQPFAYTFMDEDFNHLYQSEQRMGLIFTIFTALAVLVACLGLFGLITYAAEQRTKEIGIRKVLGATAGNIITLLSRDFLRLILVSAVIAFPLAWWGMHQWLQGFAYRTSISVWTFVLAGAATLAATLLTISYQAIRSAIANPVDSLKNE